MSRSSSCANPDDTSKVTLETILTHSVGLPPYAYDNLLEAGQAPIDILSKYAGVRPTCAPGDCFTYQNVTFNIIATAIERVTGKTYEQELRARILDPLGMTATTLGRAGLTASGNWAKPHKRAGMTWIPTDGEAALLQRAGRGRGQLQPQRHEQVADRADGRAAGRAAPGHPR